MDPSQQQKLKDMTEMGFDEAQSKQALNLCDYNIEQAINLYITYKSRAGIQTSRY